MKILVSACLLGEKCKYDGGSNFNETVAAFCRGKEVIAVCPEISSGMGSPRVPAEIVNGKVTDRNGKDVDEIYRGGVEKVMEEIKGEGIELAVLKARSPTCGVREIYDGTFTGTKIKGVGIFAEALMEKGISVMDEEELERNFFLKHKEEL